MKGFDCLSSINILWNTNDINPIIAHQLHMQPLTSCACLIWTIQDKKMLYTVFFSFLFELLILKIIKRLIVFIISAEIVQVGLQKWPNLLEASRGPETFGQDWGIIICLIQNF